jgi:hypothetical protein
MILVFNVYWVPTLKVVKASIYPNHFIRFKPEISSNHQQNSTIVPPKSVARLRYMSNHRKVEKHSYEVGIEDFLR